MTRRTEMSWRTRTAALVAGLAVAASVASVGAVAVPTAAFADTASVTITQQANSDATYDAYRLFTATIDDNTNNATQVAWDAGVTDDLQTKLVAFLNQDFGAGVNQYNTWLGNKGLDSGDASVQKNAQNVLEYISSQVGGSVDTNAHPQPWVDEGTFADEFAEWVTENLTEVGIATQGRAFTDEEGYYLFVTTASTLGKGDVATAPIWLPLGGNVTEVDEKALPVTITKEVQEDSKAEELGEGWQSFADAEIGQEVPYRITVTVPANYNNFESFYAQIEDHLPQGLEYVEKSAEVTVGDEDVTDKFDIQYNSHVLTVTNQNTKASGTGVSEIIPGSQIVLTYRAKLVDLNGAEIVYGSAGNTNTAYFRFSNDPDSTTRGEISDTATLYVYTATVDKTDKVTKQPLKGAKFVIKNAEGKYLTTDDDWTAESAEADNVAVFTSNAQGQLADAEGNAGIKGLDAGTYTLVEIEAPEGYVTPTGGAAEVTVTVTPTYDEQGKLTGLSGTVQGSLAQGNTATGNIGSGNVDFGVVNDKNISLALTGAEGVGIGGAVVVAVGLGWYLVRRHRMSADEA